MAGRHVPADELRRLAEEFARSARLSEDTLARLDHAIEALEGRWDGAVQQAFHRQFKALRPQLARLGAHLDLISREVNALVDRFDMADRS